MELDVHVLLAGPCAGRGGLIERPGVVNPMIVSFLSGIEPAPDWDAVTC